MSSSSTLPDRPRLAAEVANPLVKTHSLSLAERLFFLPLVKSLAFTFSRMFLGKVTRQYPEEKLKQGPSFHGVPVLVARDDGTPRCVACGLCEFVCPPRAIDIAPGATEREIERAPEEFVIDMLRCIECSYCEEVCPEEAIVMSRDYEVVGRLREDFVWKLGRLLRPESEVAERLAFARRRYQRWNEDEPGPAPPAGGVFRDPRWAERERPVEDH